MLSGGHASGDKTAAKILQADFYWPTLFKMFMLMSRLCPYLGGVTIS